ncbi:MAG TPA: RNA methyltransferase [Chloroflexota bacterium]|jgi:TrmH family RNA methyltransferase|nr:RNA methyltransferase [Chloroflexota bacterium]
MSALLAHQETIGSRYNPSIKRIRRLRDREERDRSGEYYIEGLRFVLQALHHSAEIELLVVCPTLIVHGAARQVMRRLARMGVPILQVTPEVLHHLSLLDEPQGIGAVVRQRWTHLERAYPANALCWIALDSVRSPGNLGTILRTADAVGGAGLIVLGDAIDPHDPTTVRASMGAMFAQRLVRTALPAFIHWKRHHCCQLVGTSPGARLDYHATHYRQPTILLMGDERSGLSAELQALCDLMVRIPMVGRSDSLNLAIATSVLLYELFNQQRERRGGPSPSRSRASRCLGTANR